MLYYIADFWDLFNLHNWNILLSNTFLFPPLLSSGNHHSILCCSSLSTLFFVFQLLSHVRLFATTWAAAHQASLSITISWSFLTFMSIILVMPSDHLILCCPLLLMPSIFPSIRIVSWPFASGVQSAGASGSESVLPMNIQHWFPLGLTVLNSLPSRGLSRAFSSTIVQKHQFFGTQFSHPYRTTGKTIALTVWIFVGKMMLCFLICCLGLSYLFFQGASVI